jgi:hypothetical protein
MATSSHINHARSRYNVKIHGYNVYLDKQQEKGRSPAVAGLRPSTINQKALELQARATLIGD